MAITLYSLRHVVVARPILKTVVIVMGILSGISIGGGIVAIIWNAVAPTQFDILGVTLTSGHVGVAFTALGLVTMLFVIRAVLKHTHKLAALPDDGHESFVEPHVENTTRVVQKAISDPLVEDVTRIVQEAVSESSTRIFSRIPSRPSQKTIEGGLVLREYFGGYLGRLVRHLREADNSNIDHIARLVDAFLSKTWMNHLLDSSIDTYVIKDYLVEINDLIAAKGGRLRRLTDERLEYLSRDWKLIVQQGHESKVDPDSLEKVISSLAKKI